MASRSFGVALALALASTACASTSGQAWLEAPLEPSNVSNSNVYVNADPTSEARPRLRHTITLGESYASAEQRTANTTSSGTNVNVNVATYVPVTVNNYVSAGVVDSPRAAPVAPAAHDSPPGPGQDFPAPPSYGPSFPYSTSPASPWAR